MLRRLTFERLVLAVGGLLVFAIAVRPAIDNDLWWHLRSGQWMVDHLSILRGDRFSATRSGVTREPTDWLSEVGIYGLWAAGRLTAIALASAGLAVIGMALVVRASPGPVLLRVSLAALSAAAASAFWAARPQMITFVFTAVVMLSVVQMQEVGPDRRPPRWLWGLVPLFALWSNLHLGWFYGLLVLIAVLCGESLELLRGRPAMSWAQLRQLALVIGGCAVAVMFNPVGPRIWAVIITQISVGRAYIEENQPPRLDQAIAFPFFILLVLVVAVSVFARRHLRFTDFLLLGGTAAAALMSIRTVSLFATVSAPLACRLIHEQLTERSSARSKSQSAARSKQVPGDLRPTQVGALNLILLAVTGALVIAQASIKLGTYNVVGSTASEYPVSAANWIEENRPPGQLFNTFDWGGYLIWKLPEYPVWIDGRADLYQAQLSSYGQLLEGQNWNAVFARDRIGVALLPHESRLAQLVAADSGWRIAHSDETAVVLVKR